MVSVTDRWAGCGRSTAAWSLLSRPFWWKAGINLQCWCMTLAHCHDPSQQSCHLFHLFTLVVKTNADVSFRVCSRQRLLAVCPGSWQTFGANVHRKAFLRIWMLGNIGNARWELGGLSTRAVMISRGAPRTCVLASWILWLAATERWKACAPRLAAAWTSFVACLQVGSYWW